MVALLKVFCFSIMLLSMKTLAQMQLVNPKPKTTGTLFLKAVENFKLVDKDLFTLQGLNRIEECMFESMNTKDSGSINFHREQGTCMVNQYTDANETKTSLTQADGWIYYEKVF